MPGDELRANIVRIMDDLWSTISFGVGRKNAERVDHSLFDEAAWATEAASRLNKKRKLS